MRPQDAGANFGWPILEGTAVVVVPRSGLTPPVAEYGHGDGTLQGDTVIGGYVYRGPIEQLQRPVRVRRFHHPNVWSIPILRVLQGTTLPSSEFTVRKPDFRPNAGRFDNIVSFGEDQLGNLYLIDLDGEIFVIEPEPGTSGMAAAVLESLRPERRGEFGMTQRR